VLNDAEAQLEYERSQNPTTQEPADELDLDKATIAGEDGAHRAAAIGATASNRAQLPTKEQYEEIMWRDEQRQAFLERLAKKKHPYTLEDALKYDCEHVEALVMDMFNEARREVHRKVAERLKANYAKILADTLKPTVAGEEAELAKWIGLDETTTPQLEATYLDASVRLLKSIRVEIAANRVNRKHEQHDVHVRRIAAIAGTIDAAKTEQADTVATLAARNNDAFHASVSLASAMLKALLGDDKAPRLRVSASTARPAWLDKADALTQDALFSLFEAALVFDQLARAAAP